MSHKRFIIIQRSCPHCRQYLVRLEEINRHLDEPILILDETDEKYGIIRNPINKMLKWQNFPHLYLDGFVKEGVLNRDDAYYFLKSYFKQLGEWKEV